MKEEKAPPALNNSCSYSFNFFDVLNLNKKDVESIGHQLKTMTENRYPNVKVKMELPDNSTDDLKLHLSNCNDEVNDTFGNFSAESIVNILKKDHKLRSDYFIDLTL